MYTFKKITNWKYEVTYTPNKFLQFFGFKPKTFVLIDTGRTFYMDNAISWYNQTEHKKLGKFKKLDNFIEEEKYKLW